MQTPNPLSADLDDILSQTKDLWAEMRGANLFVTGGTGFFGCWILESFLRANQEFDLNATITVLSRNPTAFRQKAARLANDPAVEFIAGDVASFEFPDKLFDFVIHAATDVYNQTSPLAIVDATFAGTRHVLEFAKCCKAKKVLLTSSGAVYGRQPPALDNVAEDYSGAPDLTNPKSAYGEGKRISELLSAIYAAENDFDVKIARCFAFAGPYLQLDGQLAVGNFIRDALAGDSIQINGDGSPVRSYLYASDLTVWLWTILFKGESARAYNVGAELAISLADLARTIAKIADKPIDVKIAHTPKAVLPERYVPKTERATNELGLRLTVDLETALKKTMDFYSAV